MIKSNETANNKKPIHRLGLILTIYTSKIIIIKRINGKIIKKN